MAILDERGYLETPYLSSPYLAGFIDDGTGLQVDFEIGANPELPMQVDAQILDESALGMEIKAGDLEHIICGGYLLDPYLTTPYLVDQRCALQGVQVEGFIDSPDDDRFQGMQTALTIAETEPLGTQTEMKIFDDEHLGMQVQRVRGEFLGAQINLSIYNNTQLRILCSFASRGTPALGGNNWTSPQGTDTGDFDLSNLNTDVLEQRTQSTAAATALWELRCDTGNANTFVDTVAILEHNFTASARVEVQGSDDVNFGSVKFSFVMVTELENMYYIAPSLPETPARYYRFLIEDPTNPDKLQIGTILFGSALIFSLAECFVEPVRFGFRHFKDSLATEGFTNVSNDRATRKFLGLDFEELDAVNEGNFDLIRDYISDAKTDLKCLIIPRPLRPSSLAVFAKLVELPEENHRSPTDGSDLVQLSLSWDESL